MGVVSVGKDGKVVEIDGDDGYTILRMYYTQYQCTLKNRILYVTC